MKTSPLESTLYPRIFRLATGRNVLIAFALQIFFNVVIMPLFIIKASDGTKLPVLDLMFGFSPEQAYSVLASYGPEGRRHMYFATWVVDTIYPMVYTTFNVLALAYLIKKCALGTSSWRHLILLPVSVLVFDLIENRGIGTMIKAFPDRHTTAAQLASIANQFKWSLEALCLLLMIVGLVAWLLKKRSKEQ